MGILAITVTRAVFAYSSTSGVAVLSIPHADVAVYWSDLAVTLYDGTSYGFGGYGPVLKVYRSYIAVAGAKPL